MTAEAITPTTADAVDEYRSTYRRVHGKWPTLRDCVEHFDGKLLNVMMSIWELKDRKQGKTP